LWIEQQFPNVEFYKFYQLIDNHIDGAFNILREGVFLVNPKYKNLKDKMPKKFKDWKYLYPKENPNERKYPKEKATDIQLQLASERGMDINVLSIDSNTVVLSEDALGTIEVLEENGFRVIAIPFRHSEIFAGGIHCSTLDLWREEKEE
jgi:glycine amidinotransferase